MSNNIDLPNNVSVPSEVYIVGNDDSRFYFGVNMNGEGVDMFDNLTETLLFVKGLGESNPNDQFDVELIEG